MNLFKPPAPPILTLVDGRVENWQEFARWAQCNNGLFRLYEREFERGAVSEETFLRAVVAALAQDNHELKERLVDMHARSTVTIPENDPPGADSKLQEQIKMLVRLAEHLKERHKCFMLAASTGWRVQPKQQQ